MGKRLPFPPGSPARRAHEKLLEARRYGLKAYHLLLCVDLNDDQREGLRESVAEVQLALDEIKSHLAPEKPKEDDVHS